MAQAAKEYASTLGLIPNKETFGELHPEQNLRRTSL